MLARLLSPGDFGRFAAATLVAGVVTMVAESGMGAALIQRRDADAVAANTVLVSTLGGGLALTALAVAAAPLIGLFFGSRQTGVIAAVMAGWLLLRLAMVVPDALLQRRFSSASRLVVEPLAQIAYAIAGIVAASLGMGIWSLVIGTYASASTALIAAWAMARFRPQPRLASYALWREMARFGRPVLLGDLIRRVAVETPVAAIGRTVGANALGQYTYGQRVAAQPLGALVGGVSFVLLPAFSRLAGDEDRFRPAVLRALRWVCAVSFPAGLLFVPFGTPAIVLVFGEQWRQAGHIAMALAGSCAVLCLDSFASELWKATGHTRLLPRMHGLSVTLTVVLVLAAIPLGVVGMAAALTVTAMLVSVYAVHGVARVTGIPVRRLVAEIWPPAVAALVMVGATFPLEHLLVHADRQGVVLGLLLLAVEAAWAGAVFVSALHLLAPGTSEEVVAVVRRRRERG